MNMRSPMADLSEDFTATYGLLIAQREHGVQHY